MKRIIFFIIFIRLTQGLLSQSKFIDIGTDFRTDYVTHVNNQRPNKNKLELNTLKLIFLGRLHKEITYKVQQRLNEPYLESDKYTSSLEDAWFNFSPEKLKWDFTVGKQDINFGTFESDYDPSDMYLISMVFDNFNRSQVGLTTRYTFNENYALSLQISSVMGKQLSFNENRSMGYTINGRQNLFNNSMNTSLSYSMIYSGNGHYFNWVTLGSRLRMKKFFVELDAYAGRYRQNMAFDADADNFRIADNFSVSLTYRYFINQLVIFSKMAYDYQSDVQTDMMSNRSFGAALGVEYYPIKEQALRLHAIYVFRHNRFGEPWLDRQGNEINNQFTVGIKWEVSFGNFISFRNK